MKETIREVVLERMKAATYAHLPECVAEDVKIECSEHYDFFTNQVVVRLSTFIYGETVKKTAIARYPKDWWQMFKDQYFPGRLKNKFPVKYTEHFIDVRCAYPEFRPAMPDQKHYLMIYGQEMLTDD